MNAGNRESCRRHVWLAGDCCNVVKWSHEMHPSSRQRSQDVPRVLAAIGEARSVFRRGVRACFAQRRTLQHALSASQVSPHGSKERASAVAQVIGGVPARVLAAGGQRGVVLGVDRWSRRVRLRSNAVSRQDDGGSSTELRVGAWRDSSRVSNRSSLPEHPLRESRPFGGCYRSREHLARDRRNRTQRPQATVSART